MNLRWAITELYTKEYKFLGMSFGGKLKFADAELEYTDTPLTAATEADWLPVSEKIVKVYQ